MFFPRTFVLHPHSWIPLRHSSQSDTCKYYFHALSVFSSTGLFVSLFACLLLRFPPLSFVSTLSSWDFHASRTNACNFASYKRVEFVFRRFTVNLPALLPFVLPTCVSYGFVLIDYLVVIDDDLCRYSMAKVNASRNVFLEYFHSRG